MATVRDITIRVQHARGMTALDGYLSAITLLLLGIAVRIDVSPVAIVGALVLLIGGLLVDAIKAKQ